MKAGRITSEIEWQYRLESGWWSVVIDDNPFCERMHRHVSAGREISQDERHQPEDEYNRQP